MELGLLLQMAVDQDPGRIAVTDVDGTSMSVSELHRQALRAASRFRASKASQISFLAGNSRALPVALFGAALSGLPFAPLNYRLSDEQLAELLGRETAALVVGSAETIPLLRSLGVSQVMAVEELTQVSESAQGPEEELAFVDPDDVAVVLFTSGTASAPKAAYLRHRHLSSYVIGTVEFAAAGPDEALIVSVPPYHVAGISTILTNLYCGRRIVYLDPFEPGAWLDLVRRERITNAMLVPTMLARIVEHLDGRPAEVPTLRAVAYGGAKMPTPVIERALSAFPNVDFTNAYGLTETSSTIAVLGPEDHRVAFESDDPGVRARLESAGRAVPGIELRVVDETGEPCPPGVTGNLLVRGEQVAGEYATGSVLDEDGWFATQDLARIDEDGYLFVEGRADDVIIRGGENISPSEVEAVLLRHPAVSDAAVIGIPDVEWGQRIAAAVVVRAGAEVSPEELRDWAREHLRGSKTPEVISLRDELPHTATGKLIRREVRASFST